MPQPTQPYLQSLVVSSFIALFASRIKNCLETPLSIISHGRISVGPGTLYTLLGKFESANFIRETSVKGKKKSYIITESGYEALKQEYSRLKSMVDEGFEFMV